MLMSWSPTRCAAVTRVTPRSRGRTGVTSAPKARREGGDPVPTVEAAMTTIPIRDLALLSDRHSSALVDRAGAVQWLAFPRFDSPSVVGGLLGRAGGTWRMSPMAAEVETSLVQ